MGPNTLLHLMGEGAPICEPTALHTAPEAAVADLAVDLGRAQPVCPKSVGQMFEMLCCCD